MRFPWQKPNYVNIALSTEFESNLLIVILHYKPTIVLKNSYYN